MLSKNMQICFTIPTIGCFNFNNEFSSINSIGFGEDLYSVPWQEPNSTSTSDINKQNVVDLNKLDKQTEMFINLLIHSDFEDGYTNYAIDFVSDKMKSNAFAVCIWLNKIYMQYTSNKNLDENNIVVTGILRIVAYLNQTKEFADILPSFYAMIRASVLSSDISEQEAALMVIENWRNKESLAILDESVDHIKDHSLKKYAMKLQTEISKELKEVSVA